LHTPLELPNKIHSSAAAQPHSSMKCTTQLDPEQRSTACTQQHAPHDRGFRAAQHSLTTALVHSSMLCMTTGFRAAQQRLTTVLVHLSMHRMTEEPQQRSTAQQQRVHTAASTALQHSINALTACRQQKPVM
jgi:hypothetical protein